MQYKLSYDNFIEELKKGKLLGLKCNNCNKITTPPQLRCLHCDSDNLEIVELQKEGQIVTFTVIRVPPEGVTDAPYIVGLVKLNAGPLLIGRIEGIDAANATMELINKKVKVSHKELKGDKFTGGREYVVCFKFELV